jgi:hypothetical protein
MAAGNWIKSAIKRPGALRAKAGVSGDKPIPAKKLNQLANSSNPRTARQANLAKTLKKMGK